MFQKLILDRILLSEAQVERVFSRDKAIHTTMRANLSPDIVEKVLYIRYKGKMCDLLSATDEDDQIVDDENCFMPLFVEELTFSFEKMFFFQEKSFKRFSVRSSKNGLASRPQSAIFVRTGPLPTLEYPQRNERASERV